MVWSWQQPDWPNFTWDKTRLAKAEQQFLIGAGTLVGAVKHLDVEEHDQITVEAISTEAVTTSEIEGEILDRAGVQSSIRKQLGLATDNRSVGPAERGIAEMMVDLYRSFAAPLSDDMLFAWHRMLVSGRHDLKDVGCYRSGDGPMQVVSGAIYEPKVHFEAPPSSRVAPEMTRFIAWFDRTGPGSEKALAQGLGQPTLTALAATILTRRKSYYEALEAANKGNEISKWLAWFAGVAIEAQRRTTDTVEFLIDKAKLLDRLRNQINQRQEKALLRMFREGPEGFSGGLSAGKYTTITGASPATTTRDLVDLVDKGALIRAGERKHARYQLNIRLRSAQHITINERGELVCIQPSQEKVI